MSYVRLNPAGAVLDVTDTTGQSVTSGTWKALASLTLAAGTWLVVASAQFTSNATGRRSLNVSTTRASTSTSAGAATQVSPVSGAQTVINKTYIIEIANSATYYLNVYQNSGSALTTYCQLRAIRIR